MDRFSTRTVLLLVVISIMAMSVGSVNVAQRLITDLLKGYRKYDRPVRNYNEAWNITFGVTLQNVLSLDSDAQTIDAVVWHFMQWKDTSMLWNREDYDNIHSVRMEASDIITPDITLYNGISVSKVHTMSEDMLVVSYDGSVLYVPAVKIKASCGINAKDGTASCALKYGSWTYDGFLMNITKTHSNKMDLSSYIPNTHWNLVSTNVTRNVAYYACCPEPYIDITCSMEFKKRN